MTLVDAGPLVALIDRGERMHGACVRLLPELSGPLLTTWPAFTEAMYLLGAAAGWPAQDALWRLVRRGDLELADLDDDQVRRCGALMEQYSDRPMDLADASLVALAEARDLRRIFTLDRDFHVYRLHGRRAFEVLP